MSRTLTALVFGVALTGCGGGSPGDDVAAADSLSRAQRDSVVAESNLPGASAVGRAIETSDIASERAARMDSIDPY